MQWLFGHARFVRDVGADPGLLERLSGLADLKGAVDGAAWAEADEF